MLDQISGPTLIGYHNDILEKPHIGVHSRVIRVMKSEITGFRIVATVEAEAKI
jgi:hypothetical protein